MQKKISVFLPCRAGSQRIPHKNIKPFADYEYGLIELKLSQLAKAHNIDEVVLSTNDENILEFADKLNISSRTLQNWEQGTRNPTGAAVTLMRLLDKQPELIGLA